MRREGWESRLEAHIREAYSHAFAWGERDCALWAAGWVLAATGEDFLSNWRGRYTTAAGAAKLMKRRKFASVAAIATAHLPEIPVKLARRGDLLMHPVCGALGICYGRHGFFLTEGGVTMIDAGTCPVAWRVG